MTRIDDDSSERRLEEARLADKRAQDLQKKQRTDEASAFDRALAARAGETNQKKAFQQSLDRPVPSEPQGPPKDPRAASKSATAAPPKEAGGAAGKTEKQKAEASGQARTQADKDASARGAEGRMSQGLAAQASADKSSLAASRADARSPGEAKESQSSSSDSKGETKSGDTSQAAGKKGGGVKRAGDDDRDSGGKSKDQGGSKQEMTPTPFRLPPAALMAPPPLAQPKGAAGARMSAMTKEIVDKIVSRVLVGHNSAGMAEFRIDLKSSVLKGLSIKVSGGRGKKIRAVFSGSDHEVLEALKGSKSESGRGPRSPRAEARRPGLRGDMKVPPARGRRSFSRHEAGYPRERTL
ncbi:MAG: hypothetical protein QM765_14185 [Myxococcales bacterium]